MPRAFGLHRSPTREGIMTDHDYGFSGEMFPLPVLSEQEEIDVANEELLFEHERTNGAAEAIDFDMACQSTPTCRLEFREPLSPEQTLMIELLAARYEDKSGIPFMVLSREGITTLICPSTLRGRIPSLGGLPAIPKNIESQHAEA